VTSARGELTIGAVAYDPKVVTIWDGFRAWLGKHGLQSEYVLYSNYEQQVEALLAGQIDVGWNSPLAWIRSCRMAASLGVHVGPLLMRDTDQDLTSVVVVRADSGIRAVGQLTGRVVGTGAIDSPQARLLPLAHLHAAGLEPGSYTERRFDIGVGLHGDHVGGEREAARALMAGEIDAACMLDANHLTFAREGVLPAQATRIVGQTPAFDHCMMTAGPSAPASVIGRFSELLLSMSYDDAEVRPLLDLEGLKAWRPGRTTGYTALEAASVELGFYDGIGNIIERDYRP
jgi:ABC-type phosphate/phosphonate transport system substrate-binding protein